MARTDMARTMAKCPVCGRVIRGGVAGFCFGAVADSELLRKHKLKEEVLEGFCYVHYHGRDPNMIDSVGHDIAQGVIGGQQGIDFCSLACLKQWFCGIIDKLETDLAWQKEHGRLLPETEKQNAEIYDRIMAESLSYPPVVGRKQGNKGDTHNRSRKAKGVGRKGRKKGDGRR